MVIWVTALVAVALAGPAAGYFFASRRMRSRLQEAQERLRQAEEEIGRFHRGGHAGQAQGFAAPPPRGYQSPVPPPPRFPTAMPGSAAAAAAPHGPAAGHPASSGHPSAAPAMRTRPAAERFAQEPPLFGDAAPRTGRPDQPAAPAPPSIQQGPLPPAPAPEVPAAPAQPSPDFQAAPAPQGSPAGQPVPRPEPNPAQVSAPPSAPVLATGPDGGADAGTKAENPARTESPKQKPPKPAGTGFKPVSTIIDESEARKLDWLSDLSTGRRVRLQKLGYDAPEKLANLRRSEIRRLARELDVSETVILERWMPAAVEQLKAKGKA